MYTSAGIAISKQCWNVKHRLSLEYVLLLRQIKKAGLQTIKCTIPTQLIKPEKQRIRSSGSYTTVLIALLSQSPKLQDLKFI